MMNEAIAFLIPVRFSRTILMSYAIARNGVAKVNRAAQRTNNRTITLKAKKESAGRSSGQL
jgi:hypothetical protein